MRQPVILAVALALLGTPAAADFTGIGEQASLRYRSLAPAERLEMARDAACANLRRNGWQQPVFVFMFLDGPQDILAVRCEAGSASPRQGDER